MQIKTFKLHGNWKGDRAKYKAIHMWVGIHWGKPQYCECCHSVKKQMYHWANISGKYLRRRYDWKRVCVSCHKNFYGKILKGEELPQSKLNRFQVLRIRFMKMIRPKLSQYKIAKMFNIQVMTINRVLSNKSWKHILAS